MIRYKPHDKFEVIKIQYDVSEMEKMIGNWYWDNTGSKVPSKRPRNNDPQEMRVTNRTWMHDQYPDYWPQIGTKTRSRQESGSFKNISKNRAVRQWTPNQVKSLLKKELKNVEIKNLVMHKRRIKKMDTGYSDYSRPNYFLTKFFNQTQANLTVADWLQDDGKKNYRFNR
jgi:hypothetical protein